MTQQFLLTDWLSEPHTDHPLSDLDTARRRVDDLSLGDAVDALHGITALIHIATNERSFSLHHRCALLDLFDRAAKKHQLSLAPEYLEHSRFQKLLEDRLWKASFEFWLAIGSGYLRCLEQYQSSEDAGPGGQQLLAVIVGRILRSLTLQIKWILLRYGRVDGRIWRELGHVYLFAESQGFANRRVAVYPGLHGESTAREEMLKALMLYMAHPDTLTPVQLHIAERLVAHFGNRYVIDTAPAVQQCFCFDLAMHLPPFRASRQATQAFLSRYFGPGRAAAELEQTITRLEETERGIGDINLGGTFEPSLVTQVAKHLLRCWGESAASRRGRRRTFVTRVVVVPGRAETAQWLRLISSDGDVVTDPESSESWVVFDASHDGCGAIVTRRPGDWLTIGALVGLRAESAAFCRAGIVRRLTSTSDDRCKVGIQFIGDTVVPVSLHAWGTRLYGDGGNPAETALLLSHKPDADGNIELLVDPKILNALSPGLSGATGAQVHFSSWPIQMRFRDRLHTVVPQRLQEQDRDYHWIVCRLESQRHH